MRLKKSVMVADVKPSDKVLDLGCGKDKVLKWFLPEGVFYVGLDLVCGFDLEKGLPDDVKSEVFDVVFMNEFIEHVENFKTLLMQCRDILSDNGRIVISTPHAFRILYGDLFNGIGEDDTHIHCFKKSNMRNLARICGFRITEIVGTYIRFPPLLRKAVYIPTNQTVYCEVVIYKLEKR